MRMDNSFFPEACPPRLNNLLPGMICRFLPPIARRARARAPRTLRLSFAGAPVAAECFPNHVYLKRISGTQELTRCRIIGVMGLNPQGLRADGPFYFLGLQQAREIFETRWLARDTPHYANSRLFELSNFLRIIREQADFRRPEFLQICAENHSPRVGGEPNDSLASTVSIPLSCSS